MSLPTDAQARKNVPLVSGLLDYFPDALAAVAALSRAGNDQHNPGKPLHWDRDKSGDEPDALMRHLVDRGTLDTDGHPHSAKVAWRSLALLQKELEAAHGLPLPRGARSAQTAREAFVEASYEEETEDVPATPVFYPGDEVLVVKGGKQFNFSLGFANTWTDSMDTALGERYTVWYQNDAGVYFTKESDVAGWGFPPLALERVNGN